MAFAKAKKPVVLWREQERLVLPQWAYLPEEWDAISQLSPRHFVKITLPVK